MKAFTPLTGIPPLKTDSREMSGWRTIESAPKGDDLFLVATADGRMTIWRGSLLAGNLERQRRGMQPDHLSYPATHWMPLPAPPATPEPPRQPPPAPRNRRR